MSSPACGVLDNDVVTAIAVSPALCRVATGGSPGLCVLQMGPDDNLCYRNLLRSCRRLINGISVCNPKTRWQKPPASLAQGRKACRAVGMNAEESREAADVEDLEHLRVDAAQREHAAGRAGLLHQQQEGAQSRARHHVDV